MIGLSLSLPGVASQRTGGGPSLDLDFTTATASTMDSRITFSRSGMAWQTDSTGTITTAPHNLLTESQSFDASGWTKTRCAVTGNTVASPLDGTITADKITEQTDVATTRSIGQNITVVTGNTYTLSVYAKAAERSAINLRYGSGFAAGNVTFDLSAGTLSSGGSVASSSITSIGSGWYRCFCAFVATSSTTAGAQIFLSSGGTITYDGVSGNGVYLWGAQASQHNALRDYLNTSVRNLLGYSEDLSNAAWSKTNLTVSANAGAAPDGTSTADKLVTAAATSTQFTVQSASFISGAAYCFSVYAKASGFNYLRMTFPNPPMSAGRQACFDLSLGTMTDKDAGLTAATISPVGNGWYRCAIFGTATSNASGSCGLTVNGANTAAAVNVVGDGSGGILAWGAQVSSSGSLDTYSVNLAAAPSSAAYHGPRFEYNPATLAARGLLIEEARTNLAAGDMNNATYWSLITTTRTTGATAPDGSTTGITFTENASGTTSYGTNLSTPVTITATPCTGSVFVKAGTCTFLRFILSDAIAPTVAAQVWFNLSTGTVGTPATFAGSPTSVSATVQAFPNGWYRVSLTATLAAATTATLLLRMVSADGVSSDAGSKTILLWGPQIEQGSFATSHIVTTTASVTRAVDAVTINPMGSWFSATAGTIMVEGSLIGSVVSRNILAISDGTSNESTVINTSSGGVLRANVFDGGVTQAQFNSAVTAVVDTTFKVAMAYAVNDIAISANGTTVATDTSATLPTVDRLYLAASATGSSNHSMYYRKLRVHRSRVSNTELQALST